MKCEWMGEPPLVSVIVPAYNVENLISRCLDSLVNQTYPNYEVIVVNDGSTDGTLGICESYSEAYQCVRVIDKDNGGQSSARNAGLDIAEGDYIMFCDSDDFVSVRIIENLVRTALATESDLVECTYVISTGDFDRLKLAIDSNDVRQPTLILDGRESVIGFVLDYGLVTVAPWGKLYSAQLFSELRFPEWLSRGEDDYLMPFLAEKADKYVRIDAPLYAYCIRDNSVMTSPWSSHDLQYLDIHERRISYFNKKYDNRFSSIMHYRYLLLVSYMAAFLKCNLSKSERAIINNKRLDLAKTIRDFPFRRKVSALLHTLFPRAINMLKRFKKTGVLALKAAGQSVGYR